MNRLAFVDVLGDPTATPEPIPGHYQTLKSRGLVAALQTNFDEGKGTRNPATPSLLDFFCDVELILNDLLSESERTKFHNTYILEEETQFTTQERKKIEDRLGRAFRSKGISPVRRYFKVLRRSIPNVAKRSTRADGTS